MSYVKHCTCVCGYEYCEPITEKGSEGIGDEEFILVEKREDEVPVIACPKCGTLKLDI